MNQQLIDRILQCPNLPTLPTVAMQVLELAKRADVDIAEIARLICKDPALSSKILRTVNSSFYGRSQHVSTISHALVILGIQSVKTLVLGFSLVTNLSGGSTGKGFKHINYWRRSIFAATAARTMAAKVGLVQQEEAFLTALLMDIGMLVLDQVLGDAYGEVHANVTTHEELLAAEQRALGMDHAAVGGLLANQWKLPPLLQVPIASHHAPEKVEDPVLRKLTELVAIAGRCADVFVNKEAAGSIAAVRQLCLQQHGLAEEDVDAMLDAIGKRTREVASLFEISIPPATDYDAILKRANEALVEITLQSQQQATQLKQQTVSLEQQNQALHKQATTDALTGLSNRARFDAFLAEQFEQHRAAGKPLSLLLLDVDKFKSINDAHGHPAGDRVRRAIGALLGNAGRSQDVAARYGGEEMALVLPATARPTAAAIAESIRRAIEARPTAAGPGLNLPVTASIGVACFEPGSPFREPAHLLKAADLAVYNAKRSGRNCVRVFALSPKPVPGAPGVPETGAPVAAPSAASRAPAPAAA